MRGALRWGRRIVLPQTILLLVALLFLMSAIDPRVALPQLASTSAKAIVSPGQGTYRPPVIHDFSKFAQLQEPASAASEVPSALVPRRLPFHPAVDCDSRPCIALSFDDGPSAATTPQILTTLEQRHVPATFFLIGKNIAGNEDIVRRMASDGYEIGNHTWSHTDMTKLTPDQIRDELISTQLAIVSTGAPVPTLFRPPYGAIDPNVVASAGLQTALWNEDPRDWQSTDPAALTTAIVAAAKPGGVVDLHDIHQVTVDALPGVLDQLSQQNYQFVTVSQLQHSRERPGSAPFYGYDATTFGHGH